MNEVNTTRDEEVKNCFLCQRKLKYEYSNEMYCSPDCFKNMKELTLNFTTSQITCLLKVFLLKPSKTETKK